MGSEGMDKWLYLVFEPAHGRIHFTLLECILYDVRIKLVGEHECRKRKWPTSPYATLLIGSERSSAKKENLFESRPGFSAFFVAALYPANLRVHKFAKVLCSKHLPTLT